MKHFVKPGKMETVAVEDKLLIGGKCTVAIAGYAPSVFSVSMANDTNIVLECNANIPKRVVILHSDTMTGNIMSPRSTTFIADIVGVRFDAVRGWVGSTTKRQMGKPTPVAVGDVLKSSRKEIIVRAILADGSFAYEHTDDNGNITGHFMSIKDENAYNNYGIDAVRKED